LQSSADYEKRIKAFYTIEDIVSAMKAYAGVTIRKTEEIVPNIREYEKNMLSAMSDVMAHYPDITLGKQNEGKRILVAFGSSQGLCGPYNEKISDAISEVITDKDVLFLIGRRLESSVGLRNIVFKVSSESVLSINGIQPALKETISQIMNIYKDEEFYNITFVFTYISEKKAMISVERILPPEIERMHTIDSIKNPPLTYLDPEAIFTRILEEFLYISLYRCYVESLRSENWYRLRSMEGASETLKKQLFELASQQKYIRQEEITEEMLEILGSGMFYRQ
jgi:F-type H+-transporting ATPase subunit gamma